MLVFTKRLNKKVFLPITLLKCEKNIFVLCCLYDQEEMSIQSVFNDEYV